MIYIVVCIYRLLDTIKQGIKQQYWAVSLKFCLFMKKLCFSDPNPRIADTKNAIRAENL